MNQPCFLAPWAVLPVDISCCTILCSTHSGQPKPLFYSDTKSPPVLHRTKGFPLSNYHCIQGFLYYSPTCLSAFVDLVPELIGSICSMPCSSSLCPRLLDHPTFAAWLCAAHFLALPIWHKIHSNCTLSFYPCFSYLAFFFSSGFGIFIFIYYLFIFRERGREGEREGEKHQCVVASRMLQTGDLAYNPGMCPDWESNQWHFGLQACVQSTELHQIVNQIVKPKPGLVWVLL